ncbi:hypothetical protein M413DRAFT_133852 [Hebeloma cylindrosporum]|uniref:Secreted protein n=1 Tax=Hebeloma cylindrosporum TaxID=76867 RepID=A0A0C2YN19_HEBCY|nr:hypothetical protein M413DRAFT_133852 [Hebeloma cylindrosporum h7]
MSFTPLCYVVAHIVPLVSIAIICSGGCCPPSGYLSQSVALDRAPSCVASSARVITEDLLEFVRECVEDRFFNEISAPRRAASTYTYMKLS